jgi:hypothetical protein
MTARILPVLLLACVGAAGPARAQDPDSARAALVRNALCPGAEVQISTTFADRYRGRCVLRDARLLVVDGHGAEHPILYTAVDTVWMRGAGTRPGIITGAWIGGVLGGALGALFVVALCEYGCRRDLVTHTAAGAVSGAFSGGVAGGLIGRETRVWIRRYPR